MSLLTTQQLDASIGGRVICRQLDFSIESGECWALLGANGAGKTTLLHTLAGLRSADGGRIYLRQRELSEWSPRELARARGVLFQDSQDTFPATVLESALTGRHPYLQFWQFESSRDYEIARDALAQVGLRDLENRRVDRLSGGERRRLALATLLVQSPPLLLLDEPTNHLDLRNRIRLLEDLCEQARARNHALLMSLHDVNLAQRFCSHVMLMFGNGDVCAGPLPEMLSEDTVSRLYGYPVHAVVDGDQRLFWPD